MASNATEPTPTRSRSARLGDRLKPVANRLARFLLGLRRPSRQENERRLRERGETIDTLTIREPTAADIPGLARLHVITWNDTYAGIARGPGVGIREQQWREAFAKADGRWFCFVIENRNGELVGFAKGVFGDRAGAGELNKIYLLREYQRLGLGQRLVGHVAHRFIDRGVTTMSLFADSRNPSNAFHEALGAEHLVEPDGTINYNWYIWRDLPKLASRCPIE